MGMLSVRGYSWSEGRGFALFIVDTLLTGIRVSNVAFFIGRAMVGGASGGVGCGIISGMGVNSG